MVGSKALVGVIVPCFNQGRFAAECIESLNAQTFTDWTAVLVDDASTDGVSPTLCERLRSERVSVVKSTKNLGRALVRNYAMDMLGEVPFILNLDCDDVLDESYLEMLLRPLLFDDPRIGLTHGTLVFFRDGDEHRDFLCWPARPWSIGSMYLENLVPGPGVLFRREALLGTRRWRSDFTDCSGEDYDVWLQIVENGWLVHWVRDAKYRYRQHADSFLAKAAPDTEILVRLNILKHHGNQIRRGVGTQRYIEETLLRHFVAAVRGAGPGRVLTILRSLLRHAPIAFGCALAHYYGRRALVRARADERADA